MQSGRHQSADASACPLPEPRRGNVGHSFKLLPAFALRVLVAYGLLLASWPLLGRAYAAFLRESTQVAFDAVGVRRERVRLSAIAPPVESKDILLSVRFGSPSHRKRSLRASSLRVGFAPIALFVALTVATPVAMRRPFWSILVGFLMIHTLVVARLAGYVIYASIEFTDTIWMQALRWSMLDTTRGHAVSFLLPVLIWCLVTVKVNEVTRLIGSAQRRVTA